MDDLSLKEIRKGLEQQFRFKLYKDPKFPFLHSMGIRHLFQGFDARENGYVGTLHLWWNNETHEPTYHTKNKHFINSIWKAEWIDDAAEAIDLAVECERKYNPYAKKLIEIHLRYNEEKSIILAQKMLEKRFQKDMQKAEEESKTVLWN